MEILHMSAGISYHCKGRLSCCSPWIERSASRCPAMLRLIPPTSLALVPAEQVIDCLRREGPMISGFSRVSSFLQDSILCAGSHHHPRGRRRLARKGCWDSEVLMALARPRVLPADRGRSYRIKGLSGCPNTASLSLASSFPTRQRSQPARLTGR